MTSKPYKSEYYELTESYERFGNFTLYPGQEIRLCITDPIIPGIDPLRYSISNKMNIFDHVTNTFVPISKNSLYPTVTLFNRIKGKGVTYLIHRIYMLAFCYFPGCENYEVNHIDGNKHNYSPDNLEWTTHQENMAHAFEYIIDSDWKLTDNDIIEIIDMYNRYENVKDIAAKFNISTGYVSDIVRSTNCSARIAKIRESHPVTREKMIPKLSSSDIATISERYNNGEEYYVLANEYGVDRSYLTKTIKEYASSNPNIVLRPLKKFTPDVVEDICQFLQDNSALDTSYLYTLCLESFGLDNDASNRKAISNIYNGKTYRNISSKYKFR